MTPKRPVPNSSVLNLNSCIKRLQNSAAFMKFTWIKKGLKLQNKPVYEYKLVPQHRARFVRGSQNKMSGLNLASQYRNMLTLALPCQGFYSCFNLHLLLCSGRQRSFETIILCNVAYGTLIYSSYFSCIRKGKNAYGDFKIK